MKDRIQQLEKELDRIKSDISNEKRFGVIYGGAAPSVRISKLETEIAELKVQLGDSEQEFEEGQWVHAMGAGTGEYLFRYGKEKDEVYFKSGVGTYRAVTPAKGWKPSTMRPATEDEIKEALVAEAKRRGLDNSKIKSLAADEYVGQTLGTGWDYWSDSDFLWVDADHDGGSSIIYEKGQWAEKIDDIPSIEVNGFTADFYESHVEFGCARIGSYMFQDLARLIKDDYIYQDSGPTGNRGVTGIKIGKGVFTLEQIKQIAKYYQEEP